MLPIIRRMTLHHHRQSVAGLTLLADGIHTCVGATLLAGHSKWANIRHIKALKDGQRSLQFVKLSRQIRLAIQDGGSPNPALNTQLRQAVDEAIKRDMPNHTIQGILRKASAPAAAGASKLRRHFVEARVLNKVFMVCVLYTDRFAGDRMTIATLFRKGGAVAMDVRHMFTEKGVLEAVAPPGASGGAEGEEELEERCTVDAIEFGAEELEILDVGQRRVLFISEADDLEKVRQKLTAGGYAIDSADHVFSPNSFAQLTAAELTAYRAFREKLSNLDGVEDIYDNVRPPEDDGDASA